MIIAGIFTNAVAGAIWRRILGGWFGLRRSYIIAAGAMLTWPLWLVLPWYYALPASIAAVAFWTPGHEMTDDKKMLMRYGPFAIGWIVARHLGATSWTIYGEVVAGAMFWGAIAALCFWI